MLILTDTYTSKGNQKHLNSAIISCTTETQTKNYYLP